MSDKISVIIVDDIAETRENIKKLLQFESDIEVVGVARTGREGIDLAGEISPDVILMDINMPDMDGIEGTEEKADFVSHIFATKSERHKVIQNKFRIVFSNRLCI